MNAGNVEPSIVGAGLSASSTPGPAPLGITNVKPAETNFAFGRLRSKLIVLRVGVSTIDEITPVAISARVVELPFDGPPGTWPGGSTSSPPKRQDAPIIS